MRKATLRKGRQSESSVLTKANGVKYSKDRKRLLKAPKDLRGEYRILIGTILVCDNSFYMRYLTKVIIADGVDKIGGSVFSYSNLSNLIIPESVTHICDSAIRECCFLIDLVIPKGVRWIGTFAFKGCIGLTSVVIPDGVTKIGESAFEGCSGLASVLIPNSVIEINISVFYGCNLPENVKIELTVKFGSWIFDHYY